MQQPPQQPAAAATAVACEPLQQWALWQMLDSAFPTGSFAHSVGLEAAVQGGLVPPGDEAAVARFALAAVHSACALQLPFAAAAHAACTAPRAPPSGAAAAAATPDAAAVCGELCVQLGAALAGNHVARRASASQGAAMLRAAHAAFPQEAAAAPCLAALRAHAAPHQAVAYGAVCGALGFSWPVSARAFVFAILRDTISAATRLNVIGPMAACGVLHTLSRAAEEATAAAIAAAVPTSAAAASCPLVDLMQAGHDQLYARLFQS